MKYTLLTLIVVVALALTSCSEPKPGQYPPSLYKEREGMLSDSDLANSQKQQIEQQASELAEESYPADDSAAPHAGTLESAEETEAAASDAKSDDEDTSESAEESAADDSAKPSDK